MIYEHRTYYIMPGKMPEFTETFGNVIVPLFAKYRAKLIGVWQTTIGQNNEFTYILSFDSLADQEKFWRNFRQDEQYLKYRQGAPPVSYVVSKILQPVPYSPLK